MLSFWKNMLSNVCLGFLWRRRLFGKCKSLGSSPVKMSQAFHNPSISLDLLQLFILHWKVNTFKTPEMCLYLDSEVWAGWFTIIFAGSFHYFKPLSCWILVCQNVTGIPRPFDQLPSHMGKVNTWCVFISTQTFEADVSIIFVVFLNLSFLPKLTVKWDESSRPKIVQ